MRLGAIADDFTGASDLANTLMKQGMATTQFVGVPTTPAVAGVEAGVVALKTRSVPVAEAIEKIPCRLPVAAGAGGGTDPVQILFDL